MSRKQYLTHRCDFITAINIQTMNILKVIKLNYKIAFMAIINYNNALWQDYQMEMKEGEGGRSNL
jgi:hypothetical protein